MPKSRGGSNALANLAPCCTVCGTSKGSLTVVEWVTRMAVELAAGLPVAVLSSVEVAQVAA
ncbi:HNH endonuclease [Frankia sp. AgB1.9]|nr:HNH endonuclease [Frankia sp. AgW1.1]MBL7546367.1 HNH endonuclease [Frankia sp. AgB1.9]MBL7618588.1 HNH endonuclease [Frankia sp. AgB1.8]